MTLTRRRGLGSLALMILFAASASSASAAAPGSLRPIGCTTAAATAGCTTARALAGPGQPAVSPDGANLYVPSRNPGGVVIFDRDGNTGALAQKAGPAGCITAVAAAGCGVAAGLGTALDALVTPDGHSVYVAGYGAQSVVGFARGADGSLTPIGCNGGTGCKAAKHLEGVSALAASPDGKSIYAAALTGNAVTLFNRAASGALSQQITGGGCKVLDQKQDAKCATSAILDGPRDVVVSPDGKSVYVAASNSDAVVGYSRASSGGLARLAGTGNCANLTGTLTCTKAALDGVSQLAISGDGKVLYATARNSNTLVAFNRAANGNLTVRGTIKGSQLTQPFGVAATPDNQNVFATALTSGAVTSYTANPFATIAFPQGCVAAVSACRRSAGLANAEGLAVSPDSRNAYVTSNPAGSVVSMQVDRAPTCTATPVTVPFNTATTIKPQCSDPDGNPYTLSVVRQPGRGQLGAPQPDGTVTYSPFNGVTGTDSFDVRVTADAVTSNTITVPLTVGSGPCVPRPEIPGNGIDENCDGKDSAVRIASPIDYRWAVGSIKTLVQKLRVSKVPKGGKVEVRCKGGKVRGCRYAKKSKSGSTVDVRKLGKFSAMRPGATIEIRITAPGSIGKVVRYLFRAGRHTPKKTTRCLPIGKSIPKARC